MFSLCFQFGPKQEIVTPVHEHDQRRKCFLKTGHAGRNKVPSFSVAMVSSKYLFTYFAGSALVGNVISRFTTFVKSNLTGHPEGKAYTNCR